MTSTITRIADAPLAALPATRAAVLGLALLALLASAPAPAQIAAGFKPVAGRSAGGGINYAPKPGLYSIVLIDAKGHRIRVRDAEGKTIDAQVDEGIYDLAGLKIGDKIRIDFVAQDAPGKKPAAAAIWPAK